MKGCTGEEPSTGHAPDFLGTSCFIRKKADAWTDLLRLVGTVDRTPIHVVETVKMGVWENACCRKKLLCLCTVKVMCPDQLVDLCT